MDCTPGNNLRSWVGLACGLASLSWLASQADAAGARIALSLTGEACARQQAAIETTLLQTPGVRSVDLRSVPGHLLIDVEEGLVTTDQLAATVNGLTAPQGSCVAEAMQSCITAEMPTGTPRLRPTDASGRFASTE